MNKNELKLRPNVQNRIESVAMLLISQRNSTTLTFVDVAAAAHCSLQTLYRYYGTIEKLWIACVARILKTISDRLIDHLQGIEDPKERCRKAFWLMLDFFEQHELSVQLFMNTMHLQTWVQDESFRQAEVSRVMLELIEEGQNAGVLTTEVDKIAILDFIYGVLFRFILFRQIRHDETSNAARANVLFEMVWRGISNPKLET